MKIECKLFIVELYKRNILHYDVLMQEIVIRSKSIEFMNVEYDFIITLSN